MKTALIVVDLQRDFCEGGALAVEGGNQVAETIANFIKQHGHTYQEIVYTKDWHEDWPNTNGGHFAADPDYVDTWPIHCVQNSRGSLFHPALERVDYDKVFYKGQGAPHYSGFQGRNKNGTHLLYFLKNAGIDTVHVCGLAGDYCVKETALDAVKHGFNVDYLAALVASVGGTKATRESLRRVESALDATD